MIDNIIFDEWFLGINEKNFSSQYFFVVVHENGEIEFIKNIESENSESLALLITDVLGRRSQYFTMPALKNNYKFLLHDMTNGVYIYEITNKHYRLQSGKFLLK